MDPIDIKRVQSEIHLYVGNEIKKKIVIYSSKLLVSNTYKRPWLLKIH